MCVSFGVYYERVCSKYDDDDDCLKIFAWGVCVFFSLSFFCLNFLQIFFYFAQSVFVCGCKDDKRERERKRRKKKSRTTIILRVSKSAKLRRQKQQRGAPPPRREREGTFLLAREILNDGFARRILLPQRRFGFSNREREREREAIGGGVFV